MSRQSVPARNAQPLSSLPSNGVSDVAVIAALVTAASHLFLASNVVGFDGTLAVPILLDGLGFLGRIVPFPSRCWRREHYLVAVGYAPVTIVACFVMSGRLDPLAVAAKTAEGVLALAVAYRYTSESPR